MSAPRPFSWLSGWLDRRIDARIAAREARRHSHLMEMLRARPFTADANALQPKVEDRAPGWMGA